MMLTEVEEIITEESEKEMTSFNHSYICKEVLRQLFQIENIDAFPKLTLDANQELK